MRLIDADKLKCIYPQNKAMHEALNHARTINAIVIPKNATNGEVIMAMFDCQEDEKQWGNDTILVTFKGKNNPSHNFDLDWWNAPYKKESEE